MANKGTGLGHLHYKMMSRCYREKDVMYKDYGAKGIKVCEEWHDREVFRKWCKDNGWNKNLRLNRIDGTKDYCPENCILGNKNTLRNGIGKYTRNVRNHRKEMKELCGVPNKYSHLRIYRIFKGMHSRCEIPTNSHYENYGARGISVCKEWSGKDGFFNFKKWAMNNGWVKGLTLERKDNDKGYYPDNCKFATRIEQNYHRRNNIMYEYSGIKMPLGMIAKLEDVKYGLLYTRVRENGMSVTQALEDIKGGI